MNIPSILHVLRDRRILEKTIFSYLLEDKERHKILFVGCKWYTRRYNRIFAEKDYCTIDKDPKQKRYGTRHHIVDSLENLAVHFGPRELDVIICNGVVGWGLNQKHAVETAFAASFDCLRIGGMLIIGWNNTAKRSGRSSGGHGTTILDACDALKRFERFSFPGLGSWRHETGSLNRHVFDFYVRGVAKSR